MTYQIYAKGKKVGTIKSDDIESDDFYDSLRKIEKKNRLIGVQIDIYCEKLQWVSTHLTFKN